MSVESNILDVQNGLNGKQARISDLVIDNLTVHNKIRFDRIDIGDLTADNITVKNNLNSKNISISGNSTFSGNVTINSGLTVNGNSNFSGSTSIPNISVGELRNVTIKGWLKVESDITAGGEIRGSRVWKAVWN